MTTNGIFHNPDGEVITSQGHALIGNNIYVNIYNSISNQPLQSESIRASSNPPNGIDTRKINTGLTELKESQNADAIFEIIYKRPIICERKERPQTQERKKKFSPRMKTQKPKEPSKNKKAVRLKSERGWKEVYADTTKDKKRAKSLPKKKLIKANLSSKKCSIPHSENQYKGKYKELFLSLTTKKNKHECKCSEKEMKNEAAKEKLKKVKLAGEDIRKKNLHLSKPIEKYIDPADKFKEAAKKKEKEEAELKRLKRKQKLDGRHKEMGLEKIHKEKVDNKELKSKSRPQSAGIKPTLEKARKEIFTNARMRKLVTILSSSLENQDVDEEMKLMEQERRKGLLATQKEKNKQFDIDKKKEVENKKLKQADNLKKLEEARKKSLEKKAKPAKLQINKPGEGQINILQINKWINEEKIPSAEIKKMEKRIPNDIPSAIFTQNRPKSAETLSNRFNLLKKQQIISENKAKIIREQQMIKPTKIISGVIHQIKSKSHWENKEIQTNLNDDLIIQQIDKQVNVVKQPESMNRKKQLESQSLISDSKKEPIINETNIMEKESKKNETIGRKSMQTTSSTNFPGVLNLSEHLQKQKTEQTSRLKNAVIVIQRHIRGFLVRKGIKNVRNETSIIEEQYGNSSPVSSKRASQSVNTKIRYKSTIQHEEIPLQLDCVEDPYSIVKAFVAKNKNMLDGETIFKAKIDEHPEKTPIKIIEKTPEKVTQNPLLYPSSTIKKIKDTDSIPEELISNTSSLRKSAFEPRTDIKNTSIKVKREQEDKSIPEEVLNYSESGKGSIKATPKVSEDKNIARISTIGSEKGRKSIIPEPIEELKELHSEYKEKIEYENSELLEKFIEATKNIQQQNNEQMNIVINKLCDQLKNIPQLNIVYIPPPQSPPKEAVQDRMTVVAQNTLRVPETAKLPSVSQPSDKVEILRAETKEVKKEEEIAYTEDFEEESKENHEQLKIKTDEDIQQEIEDNIRISNEEMAEQPQKINRTSSIEIEEVIVGEEEIKSTKKANKPEETKVKSKQKIDEIPDSMSSLSFKQFQDLIHPENEEKLIKEREQVLKKRFEEKLKQVDKQSNKETKMKMKNELELWYKNERKTLRDEIKKKALVALKQAANMMEKDKDKVKKSHQVEKPEDVSKDTIKTESISDNSELEKQLFELRKLIPDQTAEKRRKALIQKRLAAEKILAEKQRIIEEGVKDQILKIEEEEAEKIYKAALDVNVKAEIEKRAKIAINILEEKKSKSSPQKPPLVPKTMMNRMGNKQLEESIPEEIANQSIRESMIERSNSIKEKNQEAGYSMTFEKSIKESMAEKTASIKEKKAEDEYSMTFEKSVRESIAERTASVKDKNADPEYTMTYDKISEVEESKGGDRQLLHKNSIEENSTDSQKKIYGSMEDNEAMGSSDIDWVLSIDNTPSSQQSPAKPPEKEEIKKEKSLLSVVERSDEEESRQDKHENKKEDVESEIAESYGENDGDYLDDFEEPSSGNKTPRDIKGRTVEPDSPYISEDLSLEVSKKDSHTGSGSAQFKISLEKLPKSEEPTIKIEEKKEEKIKIVDEEKVRRNVQECSSLLSEIIVANETPINLRRVAQEAIDERHKEIALEKKKKIFEAPVLTKEQQEAKLKEEEEKQNKKLADLYEKKRKEDQNKKADIITNSIIDMLCEDIKSNLFPDRAEKQIPAEINQPVEEPEKVEKSVKPVGEKISGIKTILSCVESYIEEVYQAIQKNADKFVESISQPLNRDALLFMGHLQNEDTDYFADMSPIVTQPVLSVDLYLDIERNRKILSLKGPPENQQHEAFLTEWSNIHNKCIFDAINDALDYYRPYGVKGPPLPWSKKVRELTFRNGSVSSICEIWRAVKSKVISWYNLLKIGYVLGSDKCRNVMSAR